MNGVCVSPTTTKLTSAGSPARSRPVEPVRRSKSQGTQRNKLQKCLSTVSYSDDPPRVLTHHPERGSLLTTRQYYSFGSTVTQHQFMSSSRLVYQLDLSFFFISHS